MRRIVLFVFVITCGLALLTWRLTSDSREANEVPPSMKPETPSATPAAASPSEEPAAPAPTFVRTEQPEQPVEPTTALPPRTLAGVLTARIRKLPWGNGRDYENLTSPSKTAAGVLASKKYNPTGKTLTRDQYQELDALVAHHSKHYAPLVIEERRLRKEASLRAIEAGRVESLACPSASPFDPAGAAAAASQARAVGQQLEQIVGQRLGVARSEWFHSVTATAEPDGVSRQNSVYFARSHEPAYFAARDAKEAYQDEMERSFFEFFRR